MVTTYLSETHCYCENAISKGNNIVFLYTGINPSLELEKHPKPKSKFQMIFKSIRKGNMYLFNDLGA